MPDWGLRIWDLGFRIGVGFARRRAQAARGARRGGADNQLKQSLYDMADSIGMLRNANEVDRIGSMNYWATGTIVSAARRARSWTTRRASTGSSKGCASTTSARVAAAPRRGRERHLAWNETEPGKGGTRGAATCNDRALMLWTLPAGAIKAANDAGAATKVAPRTARRRQLSDCVAQSRRQAHAEQGQPHRTGRIADGRVTTVTTYEEYGDWNGADYLSDVMFPKHIVQKRGSMTITDLTSPRPTPTTRTSSCPCPTASRATGRLGRRVLLDPPDCS
jgi:hypothetical protein